MQNPRVKSKDFSNLSLQILIRTDSDTLNYWSLIPEIMAFNHAERRNLFATNGENQRRPNRFGLFITRISTEVKAACSRYEELCVTFSTSVGNVYWIRRYWSSSSGGMSRIGSDGFWDIEWEKIRLKWGQNSARTEIIGSQWTTNVYVNYRIIGLLDVVKLSL